MDVLYLIICISEPLLLLQIHARFSRRDRGRRNDRPVFRGAHYTRKVILVRFIKKVHLLADTVICQIPVLDDTVVHRIGDAHHVPDVRMKIPAELVNDLLVFFCRIISDRIDGMSIESDRHNGDAYDRDHGKRQGYCPLKASLFVLVLNVFYHQLLSVF